MSTRTVSDLVADDAIHLIRGWISESPVESRLLECSPTAGRRALSAIQVTTRSPLGALAYHSGGLNVDGSWLRIWGAGCPELPRSIDAWNRVHGNARFDRGLLVADDAIGGFFAWFSRPRTIHYLSPDTLTWEDTERGYADWLAAMLGPGLSAWYEDLRWAGWREEVAALAPDQGIMASARRGGWKDRRTFASSGAGRRAPGSGRRSR